MNEIKPAVESKETAVPPKSELSTEATTDYEARIAQLEKEKADLVVRESNYKMALLKEKSKKEVDPDESEEDRIRRITLETISENKIVAIDAEKEELFKKLARENKELKLAQLNNTKLPPQAIGSDEEVVTVKDTVITPEQLAAFKAKGWTDKDIERYKANLKKYGK